MASLFNNPTAYTIDKDVFTAQYLLDVAGGGVLGAWRVRVNVGRRFLLFPDFTNQNKLVRTLAIPQGTVEIFNIFGVNPMGDTWLTNLSKGCSTGDVTITHTSSPCTGTPVTQTIKFKNPVTINFAMDIIQETFTFIHILTLAVTDVEIL